MQKRKNKHLIFNYSISGPPFFLKFCYFLIFTILLSCGSDTSKKEKTTKTAPIETEETIAATSTTKTILIFGDSLTAGYGLEDTNDAFPALIQSKIDSLSLDYTVINSGVIKLALISIAASICSSGIPFSTIWSYCISHCHVREWRVESSILQEWSSIWFHLHASPPSSENYIGGGFSSSKWSCPWW